MIDELDIEMWDNKTLVKKAKRYLQLQAEYEFFTAQMNALKVNGKPPPVDNGWEAYEKAVRARGKVSDKEERLEAQFDDRGENVREAQAIIDGTTHHFASK